MHHYYYYYYCIIQMTLFTVLLLHDLYSYETNIQLLLVSLLPSLQQLPREHRCLHYL